MTATKLDRPLYVVTVTTTPEEDIEPVLHDAGTAGYTVYATYNKEQAEASRESYQRAFPDELYKVVKIDHVFDSVNLY